MTADPIVQRLSYEQVGAWLGRSSSYIQRLVTTRGLPAHREGRRVWFERSEVLGWLSDHEDEKRRGDNRIQPARPTPKGGAQHVYPSETIGDFRSCWCGEPFDHDWPDKENGAPHPPESERKQQVVVVQQQEPDPSTERIDRKNLKGYHGTLKDFLTQCVNVDHIRYRMGRTEVILYPPDGSRPITVYARNNDSQLRSLRQWYAAHVTPVKEEQKVDMTEAVRDLAEAKNDPVEHPIPSAPVTTPTEEWATYRTDEDVEIPNFETNGTVYRCKECLGTPNEYVSTHRRGIGGHNRMHHRDTSTLRERAKTPEALAKGQDTRRYNRLHEQVTDAHRLLSQALGVAVSDPMRVERLTAQVEQLQAEVAAQSKRADDAEAKLLLMREAFQGLE